MTTDFVPQIQASTAQSTDRPQPVSSVAGAGALRKPGLEDSNAKLDQGISTHAGHKQAGEEVTSETLARAVLDLNKYVQSLNRDLQFSIDEKTGRTVIKVLDSETKEVIRQIPPEEVLSLARNLKESGASVILQVKA